MVKQYKLRFNLDNEFDQDAYEKLIEHTKDVPIIDYIHHIIEQEYQRQLIINTIQDEIKKYKENTKKDGK